MCVSHRKHIHCTHVISVIHGIKEQQHFFSACKITNKIKTDLPHQGKITNKLETDRQQIYHTKSCHRKLTCIAMIEETMLSCCHLVILCFSFRLPLSPDPWYLILCTFIPLSPVAESPLQEILPCEQQNQLSTIH